MAKYVGKKVIWAVVIILAAAFIVFVLGAFSPHPFFDRGCPIACDGTCQQQRILGEWYESLTWFERLWYGIRR